MDDYLRAFRKRIEALTGLSLPAPRKRAGRGARREATHPAVLV
jgi:hypothetical protein